MPAVTERAERIDIDDGRGGRRFHRRGGEWLNVEAGVKLDDIHIFSMTAPYTVTDIAERIGRRAYAFLETLQAPERVGTVQEFTVVQLIQGFVTVNYDASFFMSGRFVDMLYDMYLEHDEGIKPWFLRVGENPVKKTFAARGI